MAKAFAAGGAHVVIASRKLENCQTLADEIEAHPDCSGRALAVAFNASDWDDCTALVELVVKEFGRIDVLVNNAGGSPLYGTRAWPRLARSCLTVRKLRDDALIRASQWAWLSSCARVGAHARKKPPKRKQRAQVRNRTSDRRKPGLVRRLSPRGNHAAADGYMIISSLRALARATELVGQRRRQSLGEVQRESVSDFRIRVANAAGRKLREHCPPRPALPALVDAHQQRVGQSRRRAQHNIDHPPADPRTVHIRR